MQNSRSKPLDSDEHYVYGTTINSSEYDKEISQSQTADNPMAPRGRANQPSRDTRMTN